LNLQSSLYKSAASPLSYKGKNSPALHLEHCCFLDTYPDFSAGRKKARRIIFESVRGRFISSNKELIDLTPIGFLFAGLDASYKTSWLLG